MSSQNIMHMYDIKAGKVEIGDYFYANKLFSHDRIDDGNVKCLGQIFAIDQHVWAISLNDERVVWNRKVGNNPLNFFSKELVGNDLRSLLNDLSCEFYAQGVQNKPEYEALYCASHVGILPDGCSSYLPTGGQWKLILENLCGLNTHDNLHWICTQQNEIGINDVYWVSNVYDNKEVYTIDVSKTAVFRCEDEVGQTYNMRYVIKIGE